MGEGATDRHDDYWKIDDQYYYMAKQLRTMLEDRHYHVGGIKDVGRLEGCLRRSRLGLMSYHNCGNEELRRLIAVRKLNDSITDGLREGDRQELLAILDCADLQPSFHRFLELPPELRNQVYKYYYAECRDVVFAPTQPPLTRCCILVRREALHMFYATRVFTLQLRRTTNYHDRCNLLSMGERQLLFWHSARPEHIAAITSLSVSVLLCLPFRREDIPDMAGQHLPRLLDFARLPTAKAARVGYWMAQLPTGLPEIEVKKCLKVAGSIERVADAMKKRAGGGGGLT
ncbi:hypothetical protein LTR53_002465 [Teratosphaeriaceae sp. CCFEE 6253]|nr:hypothetical protein LTR53_002465 [Teratosphaeriaceae sp. CCFEE 6253]